MKTKKATKKAALFIETSGTTESPMLTFRLEHEGISVSGDSSNMNVAHYEQYLKRTLKKKLGCTLVRFDIYTN